jgi:uncharacterized protein YrrD
VSDVDRSVYSETFLDEGSFLGLKVFSKEGGELGFVKDVLFDSKSGKVESLEISDGLFQDVLQGRKMLPLFGKVEMGEDFAIVGNEAVEEMQDTGGGIRNKLLK